MKQLIGKNLLHVYIASRMLILLAILLCSNMATAQETYSRWSFRFGSALYAPLKATTSIGPESIKFLPSAGWSMSVSYSLFAHGTTGFAVYYSLGGSSGLTNTIFDHHDYPVVLPAGGRYYFIYTYHGVGFTSKFRLTENARITCGIGNRFYRPTGTGFHIQARQSGTGNTIVVLDAEVHGPSSYFCPELRVGYERRLFKNNPSWRWEVVFNYAPVSVISGTFVLFPSVPDYYSIGSIRLRQSYVLIGLVYNRAAKQI